MAATDSGADASLYAICSRNATKVLLVGVLAVEAIEGGLLRSERARDRRRTQHRRTRPCRARRRRDLRRWESEHIYDTRSMRLATPRRAEKVRRHSATTHPSQWRARTQSLSDIARHASSLESCDINYGSSCGTSCLCTALLFTSGSASAAASSSVSVLK